MENVKHTSIPSSSKTHAKSKVTKEEKPKQSYVGNRSAKYYNQIFEALPKYIDIDTRKVNQDTASPQNDFTSELIKVLNQTKEELISISKDTNLNESQKLDKLRKLLTNKDLLQKLKKSTENTTEEITPAVILDKIFIKDKKKADDTNISTYELSNFIIDIATEGIFTRAERRVLLLLEKLASGLKLKKEDKTHIKLLKGIALAVLTIIASPFLVSSAILFGTAGMLAVAIAAPIAIALIITIAIPLAIIVLVLSILGTATLILPSTILLPLGALLELRKRFNPKPELKSN